MNIIDIKVERIQERNTGKLNKQKYIFLKNHAWTVSLHTLNS